MRVPGGAQLARLRCQRDLKRLLGTLHPDVISVHNLHGGQDRGWSLDVVDICASVAPTIWTLHDMWSFTGSCSYSFDCLQWQNGCSDRCTCPDEYPKSASERLAAEWESRRDLLLRHPRLAAIAPSSWLAERAREGLWKDHDVAHIPNSVPLLDRFVVRERRVAREDVGLRSSAEPVLLAAAPSIWETRKGGDLLFEALVLVRQKPLTIMVLGAEGSHQEIPGVDIKYFGHVQDEERLGQIYAAADLLVHPALEENLPNVILEAFSCGTPVVAFATGGVPELVEQGVTGWMADSMDAPSLAEAIDNALRSHQLVNVGSNCRTVAERTFYPSRQAEHFVGFAQQIRDKSLRRLGENTLHTFTTR